MTPDIALQYDRQVPKKRISKFTIGVILLALVYSGFALYTANALPLRLVQGTSMEPVLHAGDVVMIKTIPISQVQIGDIVAYETPIVVSDSIMAPPAILHRVIKVKSGRSGPVLTTKGDNTYVDPWPVDADSFIGVQILSIPYIGIPLVYATSPTGLLTVSIGALVVLLAYLVIIFNAFVLKSRKEASV